MSTIEARRKGKVRGTVNLEVFVRLLVDDGGNDRFRAEAYFEGEKGTVRIGGVDIVPYPPNPLFSIVPHGTPFLKKGIELAVSSALLGAAGPMVGDCIDKNGNSKSGFRLCIEAKINIIADAAFESALAQAEKMYEPE